MIQKIKRTLFYRHPFADLFIKFSNMTTEIRKQSVILEDEERQDLSILPKAAFGVITDVQYANVDDGTNYDKTKIRYHRNSLNLVRDAVKSWKKYETDTSTKLKCVIQLGDLVDGKSRALNDSEPAMYKALDEFKEIATSDESNDNAKLLHIWGNHEFYNFKRNKLVEYSLNTARSLQQNVDANANYYFYDITDKLRLICLDFYEFSAIGFDETDETYKQAINLLTHHNKNEDLNSVAGMRGNAMRFSKFNGSTSETQLKWLEAQLSHCKANNINAIICGHVPLHPQASDARCLAWNYKEVMDLISTYEKSVIAYFCGHDHDGGYFRDRNNIHHITFPGIIEIKPNSNAFAIVKVYDNKVSVEGVGAVGYYDIHFK
jgi:manganese-dependent ADP-ribose/CDP-alcohol diphosphatase